MADHTIGIYNGLLFDYLAPDPCAIDLPTLNVALDRIVRFGGHTTRPISVAEHSLRVRRIVRLLASKGLESTQSIERVELHALLHDAHEALVPWGDCMAPGKTEAMKAVEDRVDAAIWEALQLEPPSEGTRAIVHHADQVALYWEAILWAPSSKLWASHLPARPQDVLALEKVAGIVYPTPGEDWLSSVCTLVSRCDGMVRWSPG